MERLLAEVLVMASMLEACETCGQDTDGLHTDAGACRHCGEECNVADTLCLECREAGLCPACGG